MAIPGGVNNIFRDFSIPSLYPRGKHNTGGENTSWLTYDAATPAKNSGFMHLGCGLAVGLTGLAAGYCIGIVGDKGVRAYMEQSRVFVGMVLILIFGEVLGLYGYVSSSLCRPPRLFFFSRTR